MIKKLQKKFILIATGVILGVIAVIVGIANVFNYIDVNNDANLKIDYIISNNGKLTNDFPKDEGFKDDFAGGNKGDRLPSEFSPEMPYETRFFTVTITADGVFSDTEKIVAIDKAKAEELANQLYSSSKTEGYYGYYKYKAVNLTNGVMYVFLDCTRDLSSFNTFLLSSIVIGLAVVLVVFVLIILLSNKAIKPFLENYQKQKQFITDANHELKTPLAVIKATNEVIELENGANEWTKTIEKETERLTSLTEKLVFLSRMDEDNVKVLMTEFSLSETVQEVVLQFENMAFCQNKNYAYNIAPNITVKGDVSLIGQLLFILLENAFKYSDEKGNIQVDLFESGKDKKIIVKNTSDYIDAKNLDKLFDRFYRSDKSRNSETGGFGIGLSIAKSIVNLHKGKISAVSHDGKTIEFVVVL